MDCTSFYKIGTYAMGDNRVSKLFAGAPIKLINNFNDRQLAGALHLGIDYTAFNDQSSK